MRLIYRQLLYGFPSVLIILNIKNLVSCRYLVLWGNLSSLIQPEVSRKTQLQLLATCCRLTLLPSSIVRYNFQMNVNEINWQSFPLFHSSWSSIFCFCDVKMWRMFVNNKANSGLNPDLLSILFEFEFNLKFQYSRLKSCFCKFDGR